MAAEAPDIAALTAALDATSLDTTVATLGALAAPSTQQLQDIIKGLVARGTEQPEHAAAAAVALTQLGTLTNGSDTARKMSRIYVGSLFERTRAEGASDKLDAISTFLGEFFAAGGVTFKILESSVGDLATLPSARASLLIAAGPALDAAAPAGPELLSGECASLAAVAKAEDTPAGARAKIIDLLCGRACSWAGRTVPAKTAVAPAAAAAAAAPAAAAAAAPAKKTFRVDATEFKPTSYALPIQKPTPEELRRSAMQYFSEEFVQPDDEFDDEEYEAEYEAFLRESGNM